MKTKTAPSPFPTLITYSIMTQLEPTTKAAATELMVFGQWIQDLFIPNGHILRPGMSTPDQLA